MGSTRSGGPSSGGGPGNGRLATVSSTLPRWLLPSLALWLRLTDQARRSAGASVAPAWQARPEMILACPHQGDNGKPARWTFSYLILSPYYPLSSAWRALLEA